MKQTICKKLKWTAFVLFMFCGFISVKAQTDTTAKLKDAQLQWQAFNNSGQADTSMFASLVTDYSAVLSVDSLNASANQGIGDLYTSRANYYNTLSQSLQSSDPSLSATYSSTSDNYNSLAVPYMQRYLTVKGITH